MLSFHNGRGVPPRILSLLFLATLTAFGIITGCPSLRATDDFANVGNPTGNAGAVQQSGHLGWLLRPPDG